MKTSVLYLDKYRDFKVFDNVAEMNETEKVRIYGEDNVSKPARAFYSYLVRYSCLIVGASWQKVETMAENLGKSDRTIKRYIAELKKAGWITVTDRKDGNLKGSNVYQIVKADVPTSVIENVPTEMSPRENAETPCESKADGDKNEGEIISFKSLKSFKSLNPLNNYTTYSYRRENDENVTTDFPSQQPKEKKQEKLTSEYAYDRIPQNIKMRLSLINDSATFVNGAWDRIERALVNSDVPSTLVKIEELHEEIYRKVTYLVGRKKAGKIKKDFYAILYPSMLNMFNDMTQENDEDAVDVTPVNDKDLYDSNRLETLLEAHRARKNDKPVLNESDVVARIVAKYNDSDTATVWIMQELGCSIHKADRLYAEATGIDYADALPF